ncbi:UNVERIFIED_CONTAM: guanine deaminase, partial [Microbacterium sp. SLM126]
DFSVIENLRIFGRYFGLSSAEIHARVPKLLEFARLENKADAQVRELSGGMRRRLTVARALINDPDLLVMDETTTGLDPQARHLIWERLKSLLAAGKTILLTTHFMEEAERLCNHLCVIDAGRIRDFGPAETVRQRLPAGTPVTHYADGIVSAGFIDTHIHYPQTQMVAAYGEQLLEWLDKYTFVAEQQFADAAHAQGVARVFLRELLRSGTTTAMVYCTVHPQSVDAFFEESARFNTRMIAGKVMMDRNAPPALLDTAETGYRDSVALIERWHKRGRQHYCITPRFAPTSTDAQLQACGALREAYPDAYVQTHLCENLAEIDWVMSLFPERRGYLDVYAHAGIVGARSVYGHGIHLTEQD